MKHAIIAIEDRRFYTNEGYDLRGIGRALYQDVAQPAARSRAARRSPSSSSRTRSPPRTTARCSRSCARRRWPTTSRASGPRSGSCATTSTRSTSATAPTASSRPRARTSARDHPGCESDKAAARAPPSSSPHEAALLAGMVASPERLRPGRAPRGRPRSAATSCSQRMLDQGFIAQLQHDAGARRAAARRARTSSRRARTPSTPTSRRGSSSRSSTSSAAARSAPGAPSRAA